MLSSAITDVTSIGKFVLPDLKTERKLLLHDFVNFIALKRILSKIEGDAWKYRIISLAEFKLLEPIIQQAWITELALPELPRLMLEGAQFVILAMEPFSNCRTAEAMSS